MPAFVPFLEIQDILPILQDISIFGGLAEDDYYRVFRQLTVGVFEPGQVIFRCGDLPTHLYIVKSGSVDLRLGECAGILEVKRLGPGECFGEASLIGVRPHTATAVALERSEILALSRQAILELKHEDLELFAVLMMNIARELARRLKLTDDILLHYVHDAEAEHGDPWA